MRFGAPRPFWRNYLVAYVMIGLGITFLDAAAPRHARVGLLPLVPAIALVVGGFAIFVCAVGWSLWSTLRHGD
jgi:hypothetical protein